MNAYALDIETLPNDRMEEFLPEIEAPKNLKDPKKIEEVLKKKKAEQITKMALDPFFGRICAYALYGGESHSECEVIQKDEDADSIDWDIKEVNLIHHLLELIKGCTNEVLVTWNGLGFDLPFIFKRAMILKVPFPKNCPTLSDLSKKYSHKPHCDLMQAFCNGGTSKFLKLDLAAQVLLGKRKIDVQIEDFKSMILQGQSEIIAQYCLKDSELTYRLYQQVQPYLFH